MNSVNLIGRLTKDPELKYTQGKGTAVCNFTLAVERTFKSQGQPEADFLPIIIWGKLAENCSKYINKGSQVGVSGRIQTRSYDAKDGTRRYVTEIIANEIKFLDSKKNNTNNNNNFDNDFDNYNDDITPVDEGEMPF